MWQKIKNGLVVGLMILALGAVGFNVWDKYTPDPQPQPPIPGPVDPTPGPPNPPPDDVFVPPNKAEIIVNYPEKAEIGELIRIDATGSSGKSFVWRSIPHDIDFEIYDNGRKVCFSTSKAGVYTFILASAYGDEIDLKIIVIKVGEPDDPILPPPSVKGLAKKVVEWSALVKSETRKLEARALATSFESIAKQIDAGTLKDVEKIVTATSEANKVALKEAMPHWMPFLEELRKELKNQALSGTLVTPAQHAEIWREIAKGLELVAK